LTLGVGEGANLLFTGWTWS